MGDASSFRGSRSCWVAPTTGSTTTPPRNGRREGQGFYAVFNFLETLHSDGLTESTSYWSNPNGGNTVDEQLTPSQQVGIDMDGSWGEHLLAARW